MLNSDYKEQVSKDLQKVNNEYLDVYQEAVKNMERLQQSRNLAVRLIGEIECFIQQLANRPRDFETKIGKIHIRCKNYKDAYAKLQQEQEQYENEQSNWSKKMAGGLGGVAVASIAPSAALSVAMTFGTASTGTAIASLSGAAATNAALAWLGGGAVAAGGAGILGGKVLLTFAGPVGWAISGASLVGSLVALNMSNKEIARKTEESIGSIKKEMNRIKEIDCKVRTWNKETINLTNAISKQLTTVHRKKDYLTFSDEEMNELQCIFNDTEVLSKMIGETIEGNK